MKKWILVLLAGLTFGLTACEDKQDDKVFSAQQCLDKAGAGNANVDDCVNMINGISSPKAYVIRCSADFIRANISNATIVTAIKDLDNKNPGTDPTITLLGTFKFTTNATAEAAVANCTATGSDNLRMLALTAQTATILFEALGTTPENFVTDLNNFLNSYDPNNPASYSGIAGDLESLGQTLNSIAPIACKKGGAFEGNEVCNNMAEAQAQAGGNLEELAKQFLDQMKK